MGLAAASIPMFGCTSSGNTEMLPIESNEYQSSERLVKFQKILKNPTFNASLIKEAVIIEKVEMMKSGKYFFTKVTAKNGAIGYSINAKKYVLAIHGLFLSRIVPPVIGKDARDIERLIFNDIYIHNLNYKWQGLAYNVAVAYLEMAILDLLGKVANVPIGELLGGRIHNEMNIYYASGNRKNTASDEVDYLKSLIAKSGAKAVKIRLGARMKYTDFSNKRDKELIPLVRKELGDDLIYYTDANGSFDVEMGIKTGKMLEDVNADFFEEPCPFDHYEETEAVKRGIKVPLAFGEEEVSMRQFMYLIDKGVVDIPQPDLLFFGGLIRSKKIADMAAAVGLPCVPHISGFGLGFLNTLHFVSSMSNAGPYQEYKGDKDDWPVEVVGGGSLQPVNGKISVPKGPGYGIMIDPTLLANAKPISIF